jgi:hypothetical protein
MIMVRAEWWEWRRERRHLGPVGAILPILIVLFMRPSLMRKRRTALMRKVRTALEGVWHLAVEMGRHKANPAQERVDFEPNQVKLDAC